MSERKVPQPWQADEETLAKWRNKKESLQQQGIKFCITTYVDVHGMAKAKVVPIEHFEKMMRGSELYTGAALDGMPSQDVQSDEVGSRPDLDAIIPVPWLEGMAWCPSSLYYLNDPYDECSRNVLKRQMQRANDAGFIFQLGFEPEFFFVREVNGKLVPAGSMDDLKKAAYDMPSSFEYAPLLSQITEYLQQLGWNPVVWNHEDTNCQFELDWECSEAVTACDRFTFFKIMVQELIKKFEPGTFATFLAKPFADRTGNGAHFNMSLLDKNTGQNLFDDPNHDFNLSQIAHWFIGGILKHAGAIAAVAAPTVNSYKRLIKGGCMTGYTWAPVYRTFGRNNRTNMVRIPSMEGPYVDKGPRVECRIPDGGCNPYLTAAMFLSAGLEGIEKKTDPGNNYEINLYELSDQELNERGIKVLPRTLLEAVEEFEKDELAQTVFGGKFHKAYCELKYKEWWDYHNTVSTWEIDRYIKVFRF